MKIKIPCPSCGCQYCNAETISGEKVQIEICRCQDGSGEYDVTITRNDTEQSEYQKYHCNEKEIADCLVSRFKIDLETMSHQCF